MRSNASAPIAALLLAAMLLAGCAGGVDHVRAGPPAGPLTYGDYAATGRSSWYGREMAGGRTASGERFKPARMTAAHRSLPLGSYVQVTALGTGRSIVVRINDRGPGRGDRLIDLSQGAAHLLGIDRAGIAMVGLRDVALSPPDVAALAAGHGIIVANAAAGPVMVRPLSHPQPAATGGYVVQVASFTSAARAQTLAQGLGAWVAPGAGVYHVRLGPFTDATAAQHVRDAVAARGYGDAQLIAANQN